MSDNTRVLILPGRGDSGEQHWQTHWERKNPGFIRVKQREWSNPDRAEWVETLDHAINAADTPVVLIAHSLSVSLVAHWAALHQGPVKAALLVAPSDVEAANYLPGTTGFAPIPLQVLPFRAVVVASTNDERVTPERAAFFANAWGAELRIAGAYGHLGSQSNLGDWEYGAGILRELLAEAEVAAA